jgi:NAD(P)H-hydrate epimerase
MKLVTPSEMKAIETEADEKGLTYAQMMLNAGEKVAEVILERYYDFENQTVLGLVGTGNNGGDVLVALTRLAKEGWKSRAYVAPGRPADDPLMKELENAGGQITLAEKDKNFSTLKSLKSETGVLLDGILGTGFQLPMRPEIGKILKAAGEELGRIVVVAVDCPSGVDCDTGKAAEETISADLTVCMAAVKTGLLSFPAADYTGELQVVDIGLSEDLVNWKKVNRMVVDDEWVGSVLPYRPMNAHKGTFGSVMVVGGSVNYTGAVMLAGKSAYLGGCGLVRLAIPGSLHTAIAGALPEATWVLLPHNTGVIAEPAADVVLKNLDRITSLLIGPGMGMEETTELFLKRLFENRMKNGVKAGIGFVMVAQESSPVSADPLPPLVVDADALKLIVRMKDWWKILPAGSVLTPHPGEFAVMTGLTVEQIADDRLGAAEKFAREWGQIVVLKGANTLVASPDGRTAAIAAASAALARAGSGDVLAGLIAGLLAQKMGAFEAAAAGAWIHASAGLLAAEWIGCDASVLASDIQNAIPEVMGLVS